MALSGVHIEFGSVSIGSPLSMNKDGLLGECTLSQTMASAGISTISAPGGNAGGQGMSVLSISSASPIFYAVGKSPDATNGPRRYMDPSQGRQDVICNPGDKFAWVSA